MNLVQALKEALTEMFVGPPKTIPTRHVPVTSSDFQQSVVVLKAPETSGENVLPMRSVAALKQYADGNKTAIYNFMLRRLAKAIKHDADEAMLFVLGASPYTAKIKKQDYESTLQMMIEYFINAEEYETVIRCKELLHRHYINRVISESKQ